MARTNLGLLDPPRLSMDAHLGDFFYPEESLLAVKSLVSG